MTSHDVIVVGLHLPWTGVWQRPNHILDRLSRSVPVVVLEEIRPGEADEDRIAVHGRVTVVTPYRAGPISDAIDEAGIATVRRLTAGARPLVWLYTPMLLALADAFPDAPVVFDKMDELAKFAHADPRIGPREALVLQRAAVAFSGGRSLHRSIAGRCARAVCYPSGVEVEHFEAAREAKPHPDLAGAGPVFGYIGVIDERIDLDLVARLAARFPQATIAMVGPVAKIDPAALPQAPNLRYLGPRPYAELPALLAAFDVALMPFALNEHTENISPTKTLEYLAAGRPVVSTAVPDVVADHADVVHVANDPGEFLALVDQARRPDPQRDRRAAEKVRAATWDAIVTAMRADLDAALR